MLSPSPFRDTLKPPARNWLSRLLRIGRRTDTQHLVERLFAAREPQAVSAAEVSDVIREAKLTASGARKVLVEVWAKALATFLADELISDAESEYLRQLRVPLGISDEEVEQVERELLHPRYATALRGVLADGHISDSERTELARFAAALRLTPEAQALVYDPIARATLDSALEEAMADERFSAQEQAAFESLARHLGVQPSIEDRTRTRLARMALFWRIENGQFPVISVPIALQRGEECHYAAPASWHELRTRTVRVNYSGVSTSIRICKGVRFRVGSVTPQRVTREELTHIDDGTVYLTNKRVIFDGERRNSTIRYSALLGLQIFADGIVLEKATGKSPHLMIRGDVEQAAVTLSSVLALA